MSSSTAPAAPTFRDGPGSAVSNYLGAQHREMLRGWELNAQAGLPITADRGLAEAAAADGAPLAISAPAAWQVKCAWIRMPDGALWSLNGGANALTRDTVAEEFLRREALGPAPKCGGGTTTEVTYDAAAEAAAITAGGPYRWTDGCKQYMHIPGTDVRFWIPDSPPEKGQALSAVEDLYACGGTKGYGGNR
ncbi:hypothetical protein [Mycobacteroides abscessus]|uniref:hypothetical protein n=1 Tax=Mycobacteroides abscessus TaxID=36809 RepID=UPI00103B3B91|nr:hypothetical protein [Mycobacteroides abscessus]